MIPFQPLTLTFTDFPSAKTQLQRQFDLLRNSLGVGVKGDEVNIAINEFFVAGGSALSGLTAGDVLYAASPTTVAQDNTFKFTAATHLLSVFRLAVTTGDITMAAAGNQQLIKSGGNLNVGTSDNDELHLLTNNAIGIKIDALQAVSVAAGIASLSGTFPLQNNASTTLSLKTTAIEFSITPASIPSAASATLDAYKIDATTATITGTTHITTSTGFNLFDIEAPTYTDSSAVTVDTGATLCIKGGPKQAGSLTLSHSLALWIQSGGLTTGTGVLIEGAISAAGGPPVTNAAATLYIQDTSAAARAGIAVDDFYYGQGMAGWTNGSGSGGLTLAVVAAGTLHLQYNAALVPVGGTDALTINGTSGLISLLTATQFGASATLQLAAGTLAANGTVATAMSSLGPTGSHTTIQEWMLVKGTGGVNRWIPMF